MQLEQQIEETSVIIKAVEKVRVAKSEIEKGLLVINEQVLAKLDIGVNQYIQREGKVNNIVFPYSNPLKYG